MIVAVIPVKRLANAKSRLAPRLSAEERAELVVALLGQSFAALRSVEEINRIALATPEADLAAELGAESLPDTGGLNASLAHAARWAKAAGASALLILPGDLPLVEGADIVTLLRAAAPPPAVTIAPTRDGGTGALLLAPPDVIPPTFGPRSFSRHIEHALRAHVT
ncbi:MAG TPA: 2-phospho-L-lactate guanylyltransferase, partial [Chloroflexota bacterium]